MQLPDPLIAAIDSSLAFAYSFQPLAEKTLILVPDALRAQVGVVADMIGMDIETVSYVLGLFSCYPLGLIMSQIPYGMPRHIFSFLLGSFLLQFTLGVQWIHQLISSLIAYAMILILPRKVLKLALPVFAMAYMCAGHLHRQYINYLGWDLDFTGVQMVLTQKLYMVGFNLYDGEQLAKGADDRIAKKCSKYALKEIPGIIEFLGYTFCFSNLLAGPANEYSTYLGAIDGSLFKTPDGKMKSPPSNLWPTVFPLIQSLCCIGVFLVVGANFPLMDPVDPQRNPPVIITEEFQKQFWPWRMLYCWCGLLSIRAKYYFGWKNAQGANNIWYAGFEGFDEKGESKGFGGSDNMDMLAFELAPDVQMMTRNWNKKTSNWLTRYVYIRTGGNLLAVYSTSAFWHGFYPGYYFFFLSVPLLTFCDRMAKKKLSPYFSSSRWSLYGIVATVSTVISVNYMILPFVMLSGEWSWAAYKSHYFFGHIGAVVYYALLSMLPTPKKKEKTV
eukprot:Nitzschia sp. Nitz4//scaffold101_size76361//54329//56023//NITZ4_005609-RA/size76361-augustus-gene-0.2-mRNA-1//1//CDS//3329532179//1323//frame0